MKIDVTHVAKLANLPLSDEEKKKLEEQLSETLAYIERLQEINTDGKEPTNQVTGLKNILREDATTPSLSQSEALQNATSTARGMFKVNAILPSE